jgi:hypothetical protein
MSRTASAKFQKLTLMKAGMCRAVVERWLAAVRDVAAGIPVGSRAPVERYGATTPRRIEAYPSLQENIHGTKVGHKEDEVR